MPGCQQRGVTVNRECDSINLCVKGIREMCQLMERYDGHGGDVRGLGEVCS